MYNIKDYSESIKQLASSITYKLGSIAIVTNRFISKYYPTITITEDKTTWKYYMNLSGEYHAIDNLLYPEGIQVTLIETGVLTKLTVGVLATHSLTREALVNKTELYLTLINDYPNCNMLLRGLLYPTDINKLIDTVDGTIISLDDTLVESNEHSLVFKLERTIVLNLERWLVVDYANLDELYVADVMNNITNMLILKIHNLRLANIHTREVHSFHMNEYFNSNLNIGSYLTTVPVESKTWLYKHLKHVLTNVGREETLKLLIDNLLIPNGIDTISYTLEMNNPKPADDITDMTKPSYVIDPDVIYMNTEDRLESVTTEQLMSETFRAVKGYEDLFNVVEGTIFDYEKNQTRFLNHSEPTKVLKLAINNVNIDNVIDRPKLYIENWIDLVFNHSVNTTVTYVDAVDGKSYALDSKQGIWLIVKMLCYMNNNVDNTFDNLTLTTVFDPLTLDVTKNIPSKFVNLSSLQHLPSPANVIDNRESINLYLNNLNHWVYRYYVDINKNANNVEYAFGELVLDRLKSKKKIIVSSTPKNIADHTVDMSIPDNLVLGRDYIKEIETIFNLFTGRNLDDNKAVNDKIDNYKNILDSLTSYTLLLLVDDTANTVSLSYTSTSVIHGMDLIYIKDGTSKCLEHPYGTSLTAVANNDEDKLVIVSHDMCSISRTNKAGSPTMISSLADEELTMGSLIMISK